MPNKQPAGRAARVGDPVREIAVAIDAGQLLSQFIGRTEQRGREPDHERQLPADSRFT